MITEMGEQPRTYSATAMAVLAACKNWFRQFWYIVLALVVVGILAVVSTAFLDYYKRTSEVKKSQLESKLLWNNIGQCFYVEFDDFNKYYKIVRVPDCDKAK